MAKIKRKPHPTAHLDNIFSSNNEFGRLIAEKRLTITTKARGAIYDILAYIKSQKGDKTTVLVPAFHCPTVVQPALLAGFSVKFYGINSDLSCDYESLVGLINDDVAAVVIINYFGFEQNIQNLDKECSTVGAVLIEDCSHSMMKRDPIELTGDRGDVSVFSFWKNVPSKLGGGYVINNENISIERSTSKNLSLVKNIKMTKLLFEQVINNLDDSNVLKRSYDFIERKRIGLKKLDESTKNETSNATRNTDQKYPLEEDYFYCGLPYLPKRIIENAPLSLICDQVVENYNYMALKIQGINNVVPIFPKLSERTFPWCFPVKIVARHKYDFQLKNMNVSFFTFGETFHDEVTNPLTISSNVLHEAEKLSDSVICFSVHQDISKEDIDHTCESLKALFGVTNEDTLTPN